VSVVDGEAADVVYAYDLRKLRASWDAWEEALPGVRPFYAVKCNPDPRVLCTLAGLGAHFDCASPAEITRVLEAGAGPERILYAHPCKTEGEIEFMRRTGIRLSTADSVCELQKLARVLGARQAGETGREVSASVVIRIYANDPKAQCVLSNKFGAHTDEWEGLVAEATALGLRIEGVSFHVGSGASDPAVYWRALGHARAFFDLARARGHTPTLLDLGGGFTARNLAAMAESIRAGFSAHFADIAEDVCVIAEPGRYFAEPIARLYTRIVGVRERGGSRDYFIRDGLYGSFNCVLYDHAAPVPRALALSDAAAPTYPSTIYGPTCDGLDKVVEAVPLPKLRYGDWLVWDDMGAYTLAGACDFNGIPMTRPICVYEDAKNDVECGCCIEDAAVPLCLSRALTEVGCL
jgi:ornithine decarboxylase